jgi:hypothetical protein
MLTSSPSSCTLASRETRSRPRCTLAHSPSVSFSGSSRVQDHMAWKEDESDDGRREAGGHNENGGDCCDEGRGDEEEHDEMVADDDGVAHRGGIDKEDIVLIRHEERSPTAKKALNSATATTTELPAIPSSPFRQNKTNSPGRTLNPKKEIVVEVAMGRDAENDAVSIPCRRRPLSVTTAAPASSNYRIPFSGTTVPSADSAAAAYSTSPSPSARARKAASPPGLRLQHRHAHAHLAVQQVRQIEKQRRVGRAMRMMSKNHNHPQPKTAEQFYQWLSTGTRTAPSVVPASNQRRRRNDEKEYRLGLGSSGHDKSQTESERPQRRDITLLPGEGDDAYGSGAEGAVGARSDDEDDNDDDDDDDDDDDEDTAVAVATMMMAMGSAHVGHPQATVAPTTTTGDTSTPAAPATEAAWREASRIVAECHERMVSVQENAKLKQQQLRLHNEHLSFLLEASKATIEQLQMRLIFSKSASLVSSSYSPTMKQQEQHGGADSSVSDEHITTNNNKSRPSISDVRDHVESVLAHQHVLLEENSALKRALLQCGCDKCLEQYRIRQRASSNATVPHDVPLVVQRTSRHFTDSDPGVTKAAGTDSPLSNEIPIPSVVPTDDSASSSSKSPTFRSRSPLHIAPVDPSPEEVDGAANSGHERACGDVDIADPISIYPESNVPPDEAVNHDVVSADDAMGDAEPNYKGVEASGHGDEDIMEMGQDHRDAEDPLAENCEIVAERAKVAPGKRSTRRARSESGGPSLGEYLTTQQDDMDASGSLAEREYDRPYSRNFAESISLLSSMSRITFKTIDEDITVDCSMVDDDTRQINDSTARLDASAEVSMMPIEPGEGGQEDSLRTFGESNGSTPPNRYYLVGSASSITTSLSNNEHADSFRVSTHSGEATVRNANRGGVPGRSNLTAAAELRLGRPRRGRKATVAPSLHNPDVHDVSLDQVFLSSDPSKFISSPALAPFAKSQVKDPAESPSVQSANRSELVPPDAQPKDRGVWQQKYVNSDDLYSSAVMSAMEKRKKGASMPRHGRDSNSERFVAELSKCLQGGSTHSTASETFLPPDPPIAYKVLAVPSAMRSPHPLSYDDALVAAMSKESAHAAASGPTTGIAPSSASQRKGQWKAPTVFKSWK